MLFSSFIKLGIKYSFLLIVAPATVVYATIITDAFQKVNKKIKFLYPFRKGVKKRKNRRSVWLDYVHALTTHRIVPLRLSRFADSAVRGEQILAQMLFYLPIYVIM